MSESVKNLINSVNKQDYTAAKSQFESLMAQKISDAFENKKIEIASQMTEGTEGSQTEVIEESNQNG